MTSYGPAHFRRKFERGIAILPKSGLIKQNIFFDIYLLCVGMYEHSVSKIEKNIDMPTYKDFTWIFFRKNKDLCVSFFLTCKKEQQESESNELAH